MDHEIIERAKQRMYDLREETKNDRLLSQAGHSHCPKTLWEVSHFPRLLASYSLSIIGQWFDMLAIMILFGYIWRADPYMLALIPVAYAAPQAFLAQFAGVFAEKVNKIKLMVIADFATVFITIVLFFASTPWTALLLLTLRGTVNVVHFPAQQSLVRLLVPDTLRLKAVTWTGGVNQAAKIFAPMVGGTLLTFMAPQSLLLINACAFFISACLLLSMLRGFSAINKQSSAVEEPLSFFEQWRKGWKLLFTNRILLITLSLSLLGLSIIQLVDAQFPVLFRELVSTKPQIVAWVIAAIGAGALVIMTILNRLAELKRIGFWMGSSLLCIGTSFTSLGLLQPGFHLLLPILLGFICGIGTGIAMIVSNYVIQTVPKASDVSTIAGIFQTLTSFSVFLSPVLGAALIHAVGVQSVFAICGLLLSIVGLFPIVWLKRRSRLVKKAQKSLSA